MRLGEFIPVNPPQPAPEVAFTDINGKGASLADFKGKPAVVNLWATWCQPCLKEMPSLDRLQSRFPDKLAVAAISEDRGGMERVKPFVARLNVDSLKIYLDPKSEVARAFKATGLPTSIVLDSAGRVVGRVEGAAEWDSAALLAILKPLLDDGNEVLKRASDPRGR
jgi:thiol-disulfide isomerase/thioredoxin